MRHPICSSVRLLGALALFFACQGERPETGQKEEVSRWLGEARARPVDILLVIDNSSSMSAKQGLLADATRGIVEQLTHPGCVDDQGVASAAGPGGSCPEGLWRQFPPVEDLHVGVITTSLGDLGANDACNAESPEALKRGMADSAHLLGTLERGQGGTKGFAEWRLGDDPEVIQQQLAQWVVQAGHRGCGWEMTQESWFRFLVDPAPYAQLDRVACSPSDSSQSCVEPLQDEQGHVVVDDELLAQRAAFLRPNSTLGIVVLTDENDCSVQLGPQGYYPLSTQGAMPRASSVCAENPEDACCYSCGTQPPEGCASDPSCAEVGPEGAELGRLAEADDALNLRCFDPKRRFGFDMLYPIERYSNALSNNSLCLGRSDLDEAQCLGGLVDNPLFSEGRTPQDVFMAGIVGVPWQLISAADSAPTGGGEGETATAVIEYRSAGDLSSEQWSAMIGQPQASPPTPPSSPFMVESPTPRDAIADGNAINGREWDTTDPGTAGATDLQFACTFELPQPVDCSGNQSSTADYCACAEGFNDSPLCEEQAGSGLLSSVQYRARAYPGTRHLQVLKPLGERAVIGSICPGNMQEPERADHGYRPVVSALVQTMAPSLNAFRE